VHSSSGRAPRATNKHRWRRSGATSVSIYWSGFDNQDETRQGRLVILNDYIRGVPQMQIFTVAAEVTSASPSMRNRIGKIE
jgi:hypothetical protein